jgi:transcriptional antiterminator Rof (Rho-off)
MEDYIPVSCDLYDELTNAILKKNHVKLITEDEVIDGLLQDVYTKNKEEFCVINDQAIRLDRIIDLYFDGLKSDYLHSTCNLPVNKR